MGSIVGHSISQETKDKIRATLSGHTVSQETRDKIRKYRLGKHLSEKAKNKLREERLGEKGSNWQGGITPINAKIRNSNEYRLWREAVFKRDNWTCVNCKKVGGDLEAHHIKEFSKYPELRFNINNGITLCCECHKKTKNVFVKYRRIYY